MFEFFLFTWMIVSIQYAIVYMNKDRMVLEIKDLECRKENTS